jgi:hypothetical protein
MVRISPLQPKGIGSIFFPNVFFSSMDERDENMKRMKATKYPMGNFFKLDAPRKKRLYVGRKKQNGNLP